MTILAQTSRNIKFCGVLILSLWGFFSFSCTKKTPDAIQIGAVLPLTGEVAQYGQSSKSGIDLAVEELNKNGGIDNKRIEILYEDSRGNSKDAVLAFQKLISINKVPAVIGDLLSSNTLAIAPIAEKNKIILLSPTSSAPKITDAGDFIFRNCASDIFEGAIMAHFSYDSLNARSVGVIYVNNDYGVGIKDIFTQTFIQKRGNVLAEESFAQGATDFRSQLLKIKSGNPDAIYIVGYRELGHLLKQATDLGVKSQFMSTVLFEDQEILKIAGAAAEGVIYSSRAYNPESSDKVTYEFVNAFKKKFVETPDIFAALSYDAIKILALAIERGGYTSEGIRDALYQIKHFPGVVGDTTFDQNGDVIQPATLKSVRGGAFVTLKPNM